MKHDEHWRKFYDKTAWQRNSSADFGPVKIIGRNGSDELIQELIKRLRNGMKILDVGCGTGKTLLNVFRQTDKKIRMVGIDYSSGMINVAREISKGIKDISFFKMDANKTKFRNNYFNIIISRLGPGPKTYIETHRILKKKGLFFLFIADTGDWGEVRKHFGFKEYYALNEQKQMLKEAGFKILKTHKFSSTEYYKDLNSLARMLEIVPFTPSFDRRKHSNLLQNYEKKYRTYCGIKSSQKRALIICTK